MQKCQISIFIFNSPSGSPFWEALVPQGDLESKKGIILIVPRILFRMGLCFAKMPN